MRKSKGMKTVKRGIVGMALFLGITGSHNVYLYYGILTLDL